MAKHNFIIGVNDESGRNVGAQCSRCGQISLYENGEVPDDIREQECKDKLEDANQAAARITREVTKQP